ncbi:MAG: alpha/beta fold hydrolase [Alphaproteobacteria bacterium]|nr:alpha/beta fold hydrolase [Alphaproteobacteria bacterium]
MLDKMMEFSEFVTKFHFDGHPIGTAPHEVIFRQNKSCVRYFEPVERKAQPLFVSMPLINKWAVFDLLPNKSVVKALVDAGIPVYLLDWGTPKDEDAAVGMEELCDSVLHRALDRSRRHARQRWDTDVFDALGYCVGGTVLAAYCGLYPDSFRRVALLAAPIDFRHAGRLGTWADPETFPVDRIIDNFGNFPAELMGTSFVWLKPSTTPAKWKGLWERFEDPKFRETWSAVEAWNSDNIDFWGEAYRSYIKNCYFANSFFADGWPIGARKADLRKVQSPLHVFAADHDHICPPDAAFGAKDVWGGAVECTLLKGGHVGICLSSRLTDALTKWALAPEA